MSERSGADAMLEAVANFLKSRFVVRFTGTKPKDAPATEGAPARNDAASHD